MMYVWYKKMQENSICYGVPVMPFRGIVLKQGAYELCMPGMGVKLYDMYGQLYAKSCGDAHQKTQRKQQK
jgi:hypothetical protein